MLNRILQGCQTYRNSSYTVQCNRNYFLHDSDVTYYRYQTSFDEKWRTVPSDHYSVKVDSGDVNEYDFVLQQSYDGVNWSESTVKNHVIKQETTAPVIGKTKTN